MTTFNNKHIRRGQILNRNSLIVTFKINPSILNSFKSRITSLKKVKVPSIKSV